MKLSKKALKKNPPQLVVCDKCKTSGVTLRKVEDTYYCEKCLKKLQK